MLWQNWFKWLMLLKVTTVKNVSLSFFNCTLKFQNSVFNGFHGLTMLCFNTSDIAIITVKNAGYQMIHEISKFDAIHFLWNSVWKSWMYIKCISKKSILKRVCNCYFDNLIKTKKIETKNILINTKKCKGLMIFFY